MTRLLIKTLLTSSTAAHAQLLLAAQTGREFREPTANQRAGFSVGGGPQRTELTRDESDRDHTHTFHVLVRT